MDQFQAKLMELVKKTTRLSDITDDVWTAVDGICLGISVDNEKDPEAIYVSYLRRIAKLKRTRPIVKNKFVSLAKELIKQENRHLVNARVSKGFGMMRMQTGL